ncbi:hypothetical protein [Streptomyces sp. NPDC058718]|uniref:hypothetical protein n=1 Tax=Streptomyces sp. NPDC058718 TaxID=3346610 RepID=UPI00368048E0
MTCPESTSCNTLQVTLDTLEINGSPLGGLSAGHLQRTFAFTGIPIAAIPRLRPGKSAVSGLDLIDPFMSET